MLTSYPFWLALISLLVLVSERIKPWRKEQPFFRPQLLQDSFWLVFNGTCIGLLFGGAFGWINSGLDHLLHLLASINIQNLHLLGGLPLWAQIICALIIRDFIEWWVHLSLHGVPPLWRFHRVHHSIQTMDWIGNFRFHFGEVFVYQTVKHLPLVALGASGTALFITGVLATLIGHLNHANLNLSYGPFRYLINSPRMHIWHHEATIRGKFGVNFGVVLSVWDWIFRTAYLPLNSPIVPDRLGFEKDERFPVALWRRLLLPFMDH